MWIPGVVRVEGCRDGPQGRFVVAAKDLPPGTVVLTESPLVFGPKQSSPLVCVECCGVLEALSCCERCGLPICLNCSSKAAEDTTHQQECFLFSQNNIKFNLRSEDEAFKVYSMVTVLRLLLQGSWDQFESHYEERKNSPIWIYNQKFVVPLLSQLRCPDGGILFPPDKIHEAAGALDTNTFEVKTVDKVGEVTSIGRALYHQAALFNNSCVPSCSRSFIGQQVTFYTTRAVSAGEELTICYTGLLQPTTTRQAVFNQTKHFTCRCSRCRDPTEMGTFLSSLTCPECEESLTGAPPSCYTCGETITTEREQQVVEMCQNLVKRLENQECVVWTSSLKKLKRMLSTHHHILIQLKLKFLNHCQACCSDKEEYRQCKKEVEWVFTTLGHHETGEWGVERSKVMSGGDIVKQVMKSKLGESANLKNSIESGTIAKLTL